MIDWYNFYGYVIKLILVIDEFIYMTSSYRCIEDSVKRLYLRKMVKAVETC